MGCGNALPSCDLSAIAPWTTTTGCPSTSEDLVHTCTQYNVLRIHTLLSTHTMGTLLLSMDYIAQLWSLKYYRRIYTCLQALHTPKAWHTISCIASLCHAFHY